MVSSVNAINTASKYGMILAGSFGLWLIPVSIKAPRIVVMSSFVTSMAGFAYCFNLATEMGEKSRYSRLRKAQQRELTDYQFALEEAAIKEQLKLQFFPARQPQTVTVAAQALPSQTKTVSPIEQKLEKIAALPQHLELILECAIDNNGKIAVRQAMRFPGLANKHNAEEIKAFFYELQEMELGTVGNDADNKNRLVFAVSEDLMELLKE